MSFAKISFLGLSASQREFSGDVLVGRFFEFAKRICSYAEIREHLRGKYHCTIDLLFDWFGISCLTNDNFFVFICKTDLSKPVKQEFNGTVILPPLVFLAQILFTAGLADQGFSIRILLFGLMELNDPLIIKLYEFGKLKNSTN